MFLLWLNSQHVSYCTRSLIQLQYDTVYITDFTLDFHQS